MKNPRLILKLLNLANGFLLLAYLFKVLHWPFLPFKYTIMHIILGAFIIYGVKSWIEIRYDLPNLIKANKTTNMVFYIGLAVFVFGIMFKVMHWPFSSLVFIIGVSTILVAYLLCFFLPDDEQPENDDLIDNF
ncbi:MAG: hypothetical protein AB8B74_03855 [Crocinitomicaceae bacterium]